MALGTWCWGRPAQTPTRRKRSKSILGGRFNSLSNPLRRPLRMEQLEDRRMLALFVVNDLRDLDGDGNVITGSLRQAVQLANANDGFDTIIFADYLFDQPGSQTIALINHPNGGPLNLTNSDGLRIIGPGPGKLSIFAPGNNRIFVVNDGDDDFRASNFISGVTLVGGSPLANNLDGEGGTIWNSEALTLTEVEIRGGFAPRGGGAIFNGTGSVTIDRSLLINNTSGMGGGAIQNGTHDQDDDLPSLTIRNSTITGNSAQGAPDDDRPTGYGGGILNMAGNVTIEQSTIYQNSASIYGGGVGHWGFDPETDDETGEPTVSAGFARTTIRSSIIAGNTAGGEDSDVAGVGMSEGDDEDPGGPLIPQISSNGYNLFGVLVNVIPQDPGIIPPGAGPDDMVNVDYTNLFISDEDTGIALLEDFGGVLPVFMPDINKIDPVLGVNLAIDRGDPFANGQFDQRGFQFVREFGVFDPEEPRMDIGAAEAQIGNFVVNSLRDEFDGRYDYVPISVGFWPLNDLAFRPGTSLREAIDLARKNDLTGLDGVSTITFSTELTDPEVNPDPTPGTAAPTILLSLGELLVDIPVIIEGPAFALEVDATGNDPTPQLNNGDGSRVFNIQSIVEMSNLTIRGGDVQLRGGGILVNGELSLRNVTIMDNNTTGNGGAINVQSGSLSVENSTIHSNRSSGDGGGIYVGRAPVTIINSTISGNTAQSRGGGIANTNGIVRVHYSTITLNTAASTIGSGVASFRNGFAVTEFRSSIISGNEINDVQEVVIPPGGAASVISFGYNLVGDGNAVILGRFSGTGDQVGVFDPMLAPLATIGGMTPIHRLLPGSPAIDAGDPNPDPGNVPAFDQRGAPFNRIEDGSGNGVARIDVGAYEVSNSTLLVGVEIPDGEDLEGLLFPTFVSAVQQANINPVIVNIVFLETGSFGSVSGPLQISTSVNVFGHGISDTPLFTPFTTISSAQLLIDNNDPNTTSEVSFTGIRFTGNARFTSRENLTLNQTEFFSNAVLGENGGAISQVGGNLTITNSTFIGNSSSGPGTAGGAIHVVDGNLHISDSTLTGNTTGLLGGSGGAIYVRNGQLTGNNLYVTGNETGPANGDGAGIYARNAVVHLSDVVISGNRALGSNSEGAGFSGRNSDVTLMNPTISLNQTFGSLSPGGGVYVNGGSLTIHDGLLFRNRTNGLNSFGAGLTALNADVELYGTTINGNIVSGAGTHGGGIYLVGGSLLVQDSAIVNNQANATGAKGGGIYTANSLTEDQTLIINSTISGNTAKHQGGGIHNAGGLTEIRHSTITNNSVTYFGHGSGVASFGNAATTRTDVYSSIIARNRVNSDPINGFSDVDRVGGSFNQTFNSLGYNLIGQGLSKNSFNASGDQVGITDPMLGPLTFNGGTTLNHALLEGSPAINGGNPAAVAGMNGVPEFDQRGQARVQMGRIDIGAFESDLLPPAPPAPESLAAWEQGFGQPGGYDGHDFLAWQLSMGNSQLLAAASSDNGDEVGDDMEELASFTETSYSDASFAEASSVEGESVDEPILAQPLVASEPENAEEWTAEFTVESTGAISNASINLSSGIPSLFVSTTANNLAGQTADFGPSTTNSGVDFDAIFQDDNILSESDDSDYGEWEAFLQSDDQGSDSDEFAVEDSAFDLIGAMAV